MKAKPLILFILFMSLCSTVFGGNPRGKSGEIEEQVRKLYALLSEPNRASRVWEELMSREFRESNAYDRFQMHLDADISVTSLTIAGKEIYNEYAIIVLVSRIGGSDGGGTTSFRTAFLKRENESWKFENLPLGEVGFEFGGIPMFIDSGIWKGREKANSSEPTGQP